jgi:hypothetical protein
LTSSRYRMSRNLSYISMDWSEQTSTTLEIA